MSFSGSFNLVSGFLLWNEEADIFHLLGFRSVKNSKILSCESLEAEPGPCPKAALLFLGCSSLSLHPFPPLVSNCSNLPFGTQGSSWRLESVPYKQGTGDTERLLAQEPHRVLLDFTGTKWKGAELHWHECFLCISSRANSESHIRVYLSSSTSARVRWEVGESGGGIQDKVRQGERGGIKCHIFFFKWNVAIRRE